ncbi:MAG: DUF4157 domain-containing protein [Dehalococcoidia bacterium]
MTQARRSQRREPGISAPTTESARRPPRNRRARRTERSNHAELAAIGQDSKRRITVARPDGQAERSANAAAAEASGSTLNPNTMSLPSRHMDMTAAPSLIRSVISTPGMPLSNSARQSVTPDIERNDVRVHAGGQASRSADALGAHAYAAGNHVVFGSGRYAPGTPAGQALLSHELAHVGQSAGEGSHAAPVVHGFFGAIADAVGAAFAVGEAVVGAARAVTGAVSAATDWIGERLRGAGMWLINLVRDLPGRLARLATTLWEGLVGVITFIPEAIQALATGGISGFASWLWQRTLRGGAWALTLLSRVFDVFGGPEIVEFFWHIMTNAQPLTPAQRAAGQSVLGPNAIRWDDVRVSQGGLLDIVFHLNNSRAFVMFHTVNFPRGESMDVMVHELTHVFQYETHGTLYLGQAIHAQMTEGYLYGGATGLEEARANGRRFRDFNREQQGQIAQDYYRLVMQPGLDASDPTAQAYQPFIDDLRAGDL